LPASGGLILHIMLIMGLFSLVPPDGNRGERKCQPKFCFAIYQGLAKGSADYQEKLTRKGAKTQRELTTRSQTQSFGTQLS